MDYSEQNENSNRYCGADSPNVQMAEIFKLNEDCLDKLCDYLSLRDIHSFGQTCKDMQQHTGEYFQRNYGAGQNECMRNGVCTTYLDRELTKRKKYAQIPGFNRFITNFSCSLIGLHFYYIKKHYTEFPSINHFYIQHSYLSFHRVVKGMYGHMVKKAEIVQLRNCTIDMNLYFVILDCCKRLKRLHVQYSQLGIQKSDDEFIAGSSSLKYPWLLETYPFLEHLELMPRYEFKVDELIRFFELNPSVRSFSTSSPCIWSNRQDFIASNIKLDTFEIKFYYNESHPDITSLCDLLNQLYERGCYKRLNFYFHDHKNINDFKPVFSLYSLEKLFIERFDKSYDFHRLNNLKELVLVKDFASDDMEMLANCLVNLERLDIPNATSEHIIPFMRHTVKLMYVKLGINAGILKLRKFNEQRAKLINARGVTIFVPDNVFLNMKWTYNYGEMQLNLVNVRRETSHDWDHHYIF